MKRRSWMLAAVAGMGAGAGVAWCSKPAPPQTADAEVWSLRFDRPEGGELALATLRGQPLLLNFWATWCPPCVKEMPLLDQFQRDAKAQKWRVVGLAIDGPTPVRQYLAKLPMGFPIGLAGMEGVDLTKRLGNRSGALPFTVVFDSTGRAVDRKLGAVSAADLAGWRERVR